jgi:toxin ParE1/3/4
VERTLEGLAEVPGKGARREFDNPRLKEVRSWAIDGFPNHLIFYVYDDAALTVIAVVHGARDLPKVLLDRT